MTKRQGKNGTQLGRPGHKVTQIPAQMRKLHDENAELRKQVGDMKDLLFAIGRTYGRIRIAAHDAEAISPQDELDVKRNDETGDWTITYTPKSNEVQEHKAPLLQLRKPGE